MKILEMMEMKKLLMTLVLLPLMALATGSQGTRLSAACITLEEAVGLGNSLSIWSSEAGICSESGECVLGEPTCFGTLADSHDGYGAVSTRGNWADLYVQGQGSGTITFWWKAVGSAYGRFFTSLDDYPDAMLNMILVDPNVYPREFKILKGDGKWHQAKVDIREWSVGNEEWYARWELFAQTDTARVLIDEVRWVQAPDSIQVRFLSYGDVVWDERTYLPGNQFGMREPGCGQEMKPMVADPVRSGYSFCGWYRDLKFEQPLDWFDYVPYSGATVYAKWEAGLSRIVFDATGGGECGVVGCVARTEKSIGTLPTPTRRKYKFIGWYTAAVGGTKISSTTKVMGDTTYYAHWQYDGLSLVSAKVVADCAGMGSASGGKRAKAGTKVTLKATAKKGYAFAGWYLGGELMSKAASYSFKTTDEDVDYRARFVTLAEDKASVRATANGMAFAASGTDKLTLLSTNAKKKFTLKQRLVVDPLPDWACDTFTGDLGTEDEPVPVTVTVGKTGKVSGKYTLDGAKWTFSASSLSSAAYDAETGEPQAFAANVTATATISKKKRSQKLVVMVTEEGAVVSEP